MVENISISVVIPARNRANTLGRALESVLAQSLLPQEIIVIDDASSDETAEVARSFISRFPNIFVMTLAVNKGAPHARNTGIRISKGDWIALLDSDDRWEPQKLENQSKFISHAVSAIFTNIRYESPTGFSETDVKEDVTFEDLKYRNILGGSSTALVKRSCLLEAGGFDEQLKSCQDWDIWIKLSRLGQLKVYKKADTVYYFDGGNRISQNIQSVLSGHMVVFSRIYDLLGVGQGRYIRQYHRFYLSSLLLQLDSFSKDGIWYGFLFAIFRHRCVSRHEAVLVFRKSVKRFLGGNPGNRAETA